ncbi:disabled homolog 1-like isoform X2 [Dysidea avara]|uniref:disabled homolog 1-like isoform X2 n=1 Tax=Dysidea avara TaxID=196820 RepID=UPI003324E976
MAARASRSQTMNLQTRFGIKVDPKVKFGGDGLTYKARFVGSEEIMDKSGDKIAQAAIGRIRAACREAGGTKPKVLINLSLNGIKVADLKTKVWAVSVPIPRLTYVARDAEDSCVFCIIVARKKAGFKLLVYKADARITAQVVQSVRELFQVVYKMYQEKKSKSKPAEPKTTSATTLPRNNTSNTELVKAMSDSKLLDAPPHYHDAIDPTYTEIDFPPPAAGGKQSNQPTAAATTQSESNDQGFLVDLGSPEYTEQSPEQTQWSYPSKQYQVPTSNKPAFPVNQYQVSTPNKPAFPVQTNAQQEWSALDAELADIAKELSLVGGDISTPEQPVQQQPQLLRKQSNIRQSATDPFTNDFFNQPFTPGNNEFGQFTIQDDSIVELSSADPFSSPEKSAVNDEQETTDDPFTAFEFDNANKDSTNKETTTNEFDAYDAFASIRHRDSAYISSALEQSQSNIETPTVADLIEDTGPENIMPLDNSQPESPPSLLSTSTDPFSASFTSSAVEEKEVLSWTTFDDGVKTSEPIYAVPDKTKKKKRSSIASPVGAFDETLSSVKSTDNPPPSTTKVSQTVSPLQPPPKNRRSTNRKNSRPYTVYGDSAQVNTTPKANKPFDLSSIKPKAATTDQLENKTSQDPFMDLFQRTDGNMDTTFF